MRLLPAITLLFTAAAIAAAGYRASEPFPSDSTFERLPSCERSVNPPARPMSGIAVLPAADAPSAHRAPPKHTVDTGDARGEPSFQANVSRGLSGGDVEEGTDSRGEEPDRRAVDAARAHESSDPILDPEDMEVANRMKSQNVSLNFCETPLPEVISWLREFTNLNIVLTGVETPADITVTFRIDNLPFDQALGLLLRMWEMNYEIEAGVIVVAPEDVLATATVFRMYRVSDLVGGTMDGATLAPPENEAEDAGRQAAPPPPVGTDELIERIKGGIARWTWDTSPNSIEVNNGFLIVRHTPATQREIQTFFQDLRRSGGLPNQLQPELACYDVGELLEPRASDVYPRAETAGSLVEKVKARVGPETWADASRSLTLSRGFLLVRAEKPVQEDISALIESLRPRYYIRDYDVECPPGFTYIQDYDVEVSQDGYIADPIPQR